MAYLILRQSLTIKQHHLGQTSANEGGVHYLQWLYGDAGRVTINNSTISGNIANTGGGVYNTHYGMVATATFIIRVRREPHSQQ